MADKKISALTALTAPAVDDELAIVDTSTTETKKIIPSDLMIMNDTDDSNILSMVWNENDSSDRTLNLLVSGGNRSLTIGADFVIDRAITGLIDDDTMESASDVTLGTTESIKAYADSLHVAIDNVFTIGSAGCDYTTIQSALTTNATTDTLFIVYPDTYVDDTINFTANNQYVVGSGPSPKVALITKATGICDYGAFTGCIVENIKMVMTLASGAVDVTATGSGSCNFKFVHCECIATGAIGTGTGSACYAGTGTNKIVEGSIIYNNTANRGTSGKKAVLIEAGSVWVIDDVTITCTGSGTAASMSAVRDNAGGSVTVDKCDITVTDNDATLTLGIATIGGEGEKEMLYNTMHIINNVGTAVGLYADSGGIGHDLEYRSEFNHIHTESSGGTAHAHLLADAYTTIISTFDSLIDKNGVSNTGGTYTYINSCADGDICMSGSIGLTASRVLKGWFTDLEVTNSIAGDITGNSATVTNATLTTALTVNTGTLTLTANAANSSVLTIGAGAVSVSGANTGDQADMSAISDTKADFNTACTDGTFIYSGDSPTFVTVDATTFDTNVAAAGVTLAGTSLIADGTDANIDINLTSKDTGVIKVNTALHFYHDASNAYIRTTTGSLIFSPVNAVTTFFTSGTDSQVRIFGETSDTGYLELTHDGDHASITTGSGNIYINSAANFIVQNPMYVDSIQELGSAGVSIDSLTIKDAGFVLGSDADGDLYYRASGGLARLAKGTATQVLTMNAGATAAEWATASAGISNIVEDTAPQLGGDLDMNSKGIDFPTTANITDCLDEDTMSSDSATKLVTQQSVKAYVDNTVEDIKELVQILVTDPGGDAIEVGDGAAYFTVPLEMNGYNLILAHASVVTVSSSGLPGFALYNVTDSQDMLSTNITIDASENTSYTATTAPVINASYDDVATGDIIRVDIDAAGTGTKGLSVILTFQKA